MQPTAISDRKRLLLNLGCGQNRPANWVNTDCSLNSLLQKTPFANAVVTKLFKRTPYGSTNAVYMDLNKPWKFASGSVDVVYGSHVFEHLSLEAAKLFINEAYRVTKPNGVTRLVVPDLYKLAKVYVENYDSGALEAHKEFLYAINLHQEGTYSTDRNFLEKMINLFQGYPHQHKYMYDSISLRKIVSEAGFVDIREASYATSTYIPEITQVEFTEEGVPSIYVEAIKPAS